MKSKFAIAAAAAALSFSNAAQAAWKEAATNHFVVYSEGSDQQLKDFAEKLEKFDHVLRAYHAVTAPSSPIKLKVYLLPTTDDVGKMIGSSSVAGYYIPDARGLFLVGTRQRGGPMSADIRSARGDTNLDSESILLHEYTHHFMYQYFPATYPTWYSEGFAEFWGATNILPNDVIEVGQPVNYRYNSLVANRWLPLKQLLTAQSYADVPEIDLLYAQGWLLTRAAFDDKALGKQLQTYLTAINSGKSYADATAIAFPDVGAVDGRLRDYALKKRFAVLQLPFKKIDTGPVAIRTLSPAEDALTELSIQIAQGVRNTKADEFVAKVRAAAAPFPQDATALTLLSEAERLAGNWDAALAAGERAAALAPDNARALLQSALAGAGKLRAAQNTDMKSWSGIRQTLIRASKLAPNDPLVLEAYYDSFSSTASIPPAAAQSALYKAMQLAPSDRGLRYKVASDFERRDMIPEAIAIIRPDAFSLSHKPDESEKERKEREKLEDKYRSAGETKRETAREMLARLEKKLAAAGS